MADDNERNDKGQFLPGYAGGPGRPKGKKTVSSFLQKILDSKSIEITISDGSQKKTYRIESDKELGYAVASSLVKQAIAGDVRAIDTILNRLEGKPVQSNLIADAGGSPFGNLSIEEKRKKLADLIIGLNID